MRRPRTTRLIQRSSGGIFAITTVLAASLGCQVGIERELTGTPDAGDVDTDPGPDAAPPPDSGAPSLRVFVTSRTYIGNLVGEGDGSGMGAETPTPTERADSICAYHAAEAGLPGEFVAWLSGPRNAIDEITTEGPRLLTNDVVAFDSIAGTAPSLATTPSVPINRDETGALVTETIYAWTGTKEGGLPTEGPYDCSEWESTADMTYGIVGNTSVTNFEWTGEDIISRSGYVSSCDTPRRLICLSK